MSLTDLVCDASALFEFVVGGERGNNVGAMLIDADAHTLHLAFFETAHAIRRVESEKLIARDHALEAVSGVMSLDLQVWPFHDVAERAWELRDNLTIYDASYVALAEMLGAPLLTTDTRLLRAPGPRCEFLVP